MTPNDEPIARTLRTLVTALDQILGANLVGVYLYGSLTQRAFDPTRSDVDCLVVVRRNLTATQFRTLKVRLAEAAVVDPWMHRVQMQVLVQGRLLRSDTRGALYQFGALFRSGSDGNPIVWLNVLEAAVASDQHDPRPLPLTRIARFIEFVAEQLQGPVN